MLPVFIEWTTSSGTLVLMPLSSIREIVRTKEGANIYTISDDPEVYFCMNAEQLQKLRMALSQFTPSQDSHLFSLD